LQENEKLNTSGFFGKAVILHAALFLWAGALGQTTEIKMISGTGNDDTVVWEFKVSGGRKSGAWSAIPVPSNWEMQGFGTYRYGRDWTDPPAPDSVGLYRHRFHVPGSWQGKKVNIVFGGSMTDTEVKINGVLAGPEHQGGFYQFGYDVSGLLRYGRENRLDVRVRKFSTNASINRAERKADFWLFGGIFRPAWLEAFPPQRIERTAIDARHMGEFSADVFMGGVTSADRVTAQIMELNGRPLGSVFSAAVGPGAEKTILRTQAAGVKPWSAEWPNRYRIRVRLEEKGNVLHEVTETFGFRTIEVRPHDGFYVNGVKVRLKGVNRHSFWPTSGRTTSKKISIGDVNLVKDMNMNAVRCSHYPPDSHFLDAADSLGLYIIDELTGWQAAYDTDAGRKLVRELVVRDANHPSVILWANGNEGGFNTDLVGDYSVWDRQNRTVIHPWLNFNGINTGHYEAYDCCPGTFFHGDDIIMPTEFLHGLYDGGGGAGLEDWWTLMLNHPLAAGGFLWALLDEGIVRADKNGAIDTDGNHAPDGVLGPYREKEGSFFAIKKIWSPVAFELDGQDILPPAFAGKLSMENRYDFTNLNRVRFNWRLLDFPSPFSGKTGHRIAAEGVAVSPDVPPQRADSLFIDLPSDWREHDALFVAATDPHGRETTAWTWMIPEPEAVAQRIMRSTTQDLQSDSGKAVCETGKGRFTLKAAGTEIQIDTTTGLFICASHDGKAVPLKSGPRLVAGDGRVKRVRHYTDGRDEAVEAEYEGNMRTIRWSLSPGGWLRLDYAYHMPGQGTYEYLGVTFDCSEKGVTGLRWLGRGPYRVWKNRMKGPDFDVWHKKYNDAITGLRREYPEFKGFHAGLYWAVLETKNAPITMVFANNDLFLRVFTPSEPEGAFFSPQTARVDFPAGDLSFLHGIAPIGTKFHQAKEHGPAGQPNMVPRLGRMYEGTVYFYFGNDE
jgi:hypothetical protein